VAADNPNVNVVRGGGGLVTLTPRPADGTAVVIDTYTGHFSVVQPEPLSDIRLTQNSGRDEVATDIVMFGASRPQSFTAEVNASALYDTGSSRLRSNVDLHLGTTDLARGVRAYSSQHGSQPPVRTLLQALGEVKVESDGHLTPEVVDPSNSNPQAARMSRGVVSFEDNVVILNLEASTSQIGESGGNARLAAARVFSLAERCLHELGYSDADIATALQGQSARVGPPVNATLSYADYRAAR
jgi:hypothetical protein